MSLGIALKTATSGLNAAQTALRVVSDNIANVNTPGYVRKAVNQQPLVVDGMGQGVRIEGIKRITDQYLHTASLTASSDASRWNAVSSYLDNAQSLFGDPAGTGFFFNRLDRIFAAFATAADDPSSTLLRSQGLANVEDFLTEARRINDQIVSLRDTVDTRIGAGVSRANDLLVEVDLLNTDITRARLLGADSSGSENIQSQLLDELATLMNIRVAPRNGGGVDVRSLEGVLLAGDGAAKLTYNTSDSTPGYITAQPNRSTSNQPIQLTSGELRGLMDLRDVELPKISDQLGEFVSKAVDQLNAAHNAASAYPAPAILTGRDTGLDLPSAVGGFSGTSTIAIVDPAGVLQRTVAIDFTAGTIAVNGGAGAAFTPATFLASLNAALGVSGTATFASGALTLNASGGNGLAIDEGTSQKTGRGFSHFFGLNDMIRTSGFANYTTGLTPTDPHGFTPGGVMNVRVAYADGRPVRDIAITVPAAPLMSDLLNTLNNNATGVGLYGAFSLDGNGALTFTGSAPADGKLAVITDNTQRGVGGPSISQLFGLGVRERNARAGRFDVDAVLQATPTKVAMGKVDVTGGLGQVAVRPGDGRGALGISVSGDAPVLFQGAGSLGQITMSVSRYASEFGGAIGRGAAAAEIRKSSAEAVSREAGNRRQAVEGVNLDEELVNLTTYQQAFNASARMIQASSDLFDVLLGIV
jgi:flagellar hook-associated protein 1